MPLIQVPVGVPPCQVDDFPTEVKDGDKARPFQRSCKGALHLRPATTRKITDDELQHLKTAKRHAALGRRIIVVRVDKVAPAAAKPAATAAPPKPAVPPPPAPAPEFGSDPKAEDKSDKDKDKKKRGRG